MYAIRSYYVKEGAHRHHRHAQHDAPEIHRITSYNVCYTKLLRISSDLSHYLPYHQARWRDQSTVDEILRLQPKLGFDQACGALPVNGVLIAAQRHHLKPALLDHRNSGDTAGDRNRVVGYTSIAFTEERPRVAH